ncbi:pyrroloquinoline quinone precursor peptide PqqA [Nesterenkonia sp. MY13]|uniref:Coenzyme PQQ synthesis protein A n=1 Tax=Nesterenkonia sedimenti TaxID=1463632 RepID=A0A7X8TJV7_9MICC|nr:pyrroloquinoline quinone precursor peptide PqqA [Nesterenkonia sedimenti]NLS09901.1 pyrroloquinoline quinone precursor peptide PqqA [Nesterenkonia sedimenti]
MEKPQKTWETPTVTEVRVSAEVTAYVATMED